MRKPRWRSLKLGDSVILSKSVLTLVEERRYKQKWSQHHTVYWRKGLFLDLVTGESMWYDLDDCQVRGEIVRVGK